MTARIELLLIRRMGVLTVPAEAVLEQNGIRSVFVVEDGLARARPAALGVSDGTRVEVVRGLQPGEMVVVAGAHSLRDGSRVILPGQRGPGTRGGPPGGPQPRRTP
jgi:multidrug efflux pump subunit AcrA (membrane-fusion protein)